MDHQEVGKYWDGNAEAWTKLSRMGCDIYRDYVNTPAFLSMLPDVEELKGLDIGCGDFLYLVSWELIFNLLFPTLSLSGLNRRRSQHQ